MIRPQTHAPSLAQVVVRAYGLTDTGRRRKNNEDTFLIADLARLDDPPVREKVLTLDASADAILLAVSDGMGGMDAGEVASALVVEALRRGLRGAAGDWGAAIKLAVERANAEVWEAAKKPGHHGMGATLTSVCVHGGQAHVAVVGDSRAYLLRNGTIRQMTKDQSFVQMLIDAGALKPEDAEGYAMKNVVLQAMGQKPDVVVAMGRLELRLGDRLLLCSDGLSNKVSSDELLAVVDRAPTLPGACAELVELANGRGGEDNITVVIAELAGLGLEVPGAQESLTRTFQVLSEFKGLGVGIAEPEEAEDDDEPQIRPLALSPPTSSEPAPPSAAAPAAGPSQPRVEGGPIATRGPGLWRWILLGIAVVVAIALGLASRR